MEEGEPCKDTNGAWVRHGDYYIPGPYVCKFCICHRTVPKWCKIVFCTPPATCKRHVMGNICCEYTCLDEPSTEHPKADLRNEMDLRFLITNTMAFVILIILLFLIYKQCRRTYQAKKLHNRIRAEAVLIADTQGIGSIGFITEEGHPAIAVQCPKYEYKPYVNHFSMDDAPPPYDMVKANIA